MQYIYLISTSHPENQNFPANTRNGDTKKLGKARESRKNLHNWESKKSQDKVKNKTMKGKRTNTAKHSNLSFRFITELLELWFDLQTGFYSTKSIRMSTPTKSTSGNIFIYNFHSEAKKYLITIFNKGKGNNHKTTITYFIFTVHCREPKTRRQKDQNLKDSKSLQLPVSQPTSCFHAMKEQILFVLVRLLSPLQIPGFPCHLFLDFSFWQVIYTTTISVCDKLLGGGSGVNASFC